MDSPDTDRVTSSGGELFTPSDKHKDESKRTARKIGEKLRRERLNGHLTQLSEQVPWIAKSERRLDKVSILRLTVNYMKLHQGLKKRKVSGVWQPSIEDKQMIQSYLQEAAAGFMIVVSKSGTVIFVSQSINKYLGHAQVDVIGNSIYSIVHTDDHDLLKLQFTFQGQESHVINQHEENESHFTFPQINSAYNEHRSFYMHVQNLTSGENENHFELVHVLGHVRFNTGPANKQKKHLGLDETWLVAVCRLEDKKPILEISQFYTNKNEFISQHAMDGKVLFTDQRIAVITGFMASDRVGESVYSLINHEDLDAVAVSHMKIMTDGEIPSTIFRMITVTGAQIHIQSRSVIIKDVVTKTPKYIVSVNVCLGQQEGNELLEEQRKKVKALIAATKGLSLNENTIKGDNFNSSTQNIDKNRNSKESVNTFKEKEFQLNKCLSKPCQSVSSGSKSDFENSACSRGTKRLFNEIESEFESADSDNFQVDSGSERSEKNGQSKSKGDNKASTLLKSLLLSDDSNRDMEILKKKSLVLEMSGGSKCSPDSSQIENLSNEKSVYSDNTGISPSLTGHNNVNHFQNKSPCFSGNSNSNEMPTSSISNDNLSSINDITNSPLGVFHNALTLQNDKLNACCPNFQTKCQKDSFETNSTYITLSDTSRTTSFSVTDKKQFPFKKSNSSSLHQLTRTSEPNSSWNLMDLLQSHVNKSTLAEGENEMDGPGCCTSSSLKKSSHLPFFETHYNTTVMKSSNGGSLNDRITDLDSCHLGDIHFNQNGHSHLDVQSNSDSLSMNTTHAQRRERNGETLSCPTKLSNGLLRKGEEICPTADTSSNMSKNSLDKERKVKMLLTNQLKMKHNQIDNNLKCQTEEIDFMKMQMKKLQDLNNTSLVTSFIEQLSELQDEVSKQKKLLIDLKNDAVLPDTTQKKSWNH